MLFLLTAMKVIDHCNLPNMLSISRIFLAIAVWVGGYNIFQLEGLAGLVLVAAVTDLLDGLLARALDCVSDFGRMLDPIADGIFIATVLYKLSLAGHVPLWFMLFTAIRYATIALIQAHLLYMKRKNIQSIPSGKWSAAGGMGLIVLLGFGPMLLQNGNTFKYIETTYVTWLVIVMLLSWYEYFAQYYRRLNVRDKDLLCSQDKRPVENNLPV
ncbi:MAG: CDP-alcohol phosphatidyltransferase family protein [Pseudomonadota bacterium]|nr:CDP-alcohol phosphatidyltransferase family protein [Pseudomonadota bacterium]MEC8977918.1 CDP-alcohol phosphatidyltransferase family protein [Pseudomonadota bacterium]